MAEFAGYDHYGALSMPLPKLLVPCIIEYDGGSGAVEVLCKAKNNHLVWKNEAGVSDEEYCVFPDFYSALKTQELQGGEILNLKQRGYEDYDSLNCNMKQLPLPENIREEYKERWQKEYGAETFEAAKKQCTEGVEEYKCTEKNYTDSFNEYINRAEFADWMDKLYEHDDKGEAVYSEKADKLVCTITRVAWDEAFEERLKAAVKDTDFER